MAIKPRKNLASLWIKISLSAMLAVSAMPLGTAAAGQSEEKVKEVLELLSGKHVSGTTEEALGDAAVKAMVDALKDPYTQYMGKEDWEQFLNGLSRSYVGVGIQITTDTDGVYIDRVFPGTPAADAELQEGDRIIRINDQEVTGLSTDQLADLIPGEANTNVSLTILRGETELTKVLVRKPITLPVLESNDFDGVGYLKLHSFSADADKQFSARLKEMKERPGFRALVVDLRNNPGGMLDTARNIASQFLREGILIHTLDRSGGIREVSFQGGSALDVPVYVLVNEHSASASEVLAGALQDYGAAVIAGTKTYGKGSVQQIFPLSDGSRLKITVEEYFTPKGHKVNQTGITPNLEIEGDLNQLLTVLRKAGVDSFVLSKERSRLEVNGFQVMDSLPVFEADGKLWIHSRVLAALIGADIKWLPESQAVKCSLPAASDGFKAVFGTESGEARFVEGRLFIDANAFARKFPPLTVQGNAGKLELRAGKGL